jgi:hypothetical protein
MKKYTDSERPLGKCYDCGIPYHDFADLEIPDDIWEKINPTYHEGAGLLCPNCIGLRLRELELFDVPAKYMG